nr:MAG TPA_asm: hypothetical protein [Caudoviricetes sp.]
MVQSHSSDFKQPRHRRFKNIGVRNFVRVLCIV